MEEKKAKKNHSNTKYKPEYCDQIIDFVKKEYLEKVVDNAGRVHYYPGEIPTVSRFALYELNLHPETLKNWAKEYPEFRAALSEALKIEEETLREERSGGL